MRQRPDYEQLFGQVESALEERRRALKAELDGVWDSDPARSCDVLERMLALSGRRQLLDLVKERFLPVARAGRGLETSLAELQDRLEALLGGLETFRTAREALGSDELEKLAALFAEELGKEAAPIDFARVAPQDLEALARILERSRTRLDGGSDVRPVDLGERGVVTRELPEEPAVDAPAVDPPAAAGAETSELANELEEQTGILLADEVVEMDARPAARSATVDADEVFIVDEKS